MLKQLPRKIRFAFVGSLVLNDVFILWLLAGFFVALYAEITGALDFAEIHTFQQRICEQNYQRILDNIDKQNSHNPQRAADTKNSFAINVCLRNYKTGERLDVQPLIDQVK